MLSETPIKHPVSWKPLLVAVISLVVIVAAVLAVHRPEEKESENPQVLEKGVSSGSVRIENGRLYVGGSPFFIKGMGYNPIPIGRTYTYDFTADPGIYMRDFAMLREMGVNTIRIWRKVASKSFLDAAYNNGRNPIYVIMGFHVEPILVSDQTYRKAVVRDFRDYVQRFKDHPAVLMWCIGNEVEFEIQKKWPGDESRLRDWYTLLEEMAMTAFKVEGSAYHPVITSSCEIYFIGESSLGSDDNSLKFLDAWGVTIFRGRSFEGAFDQFRERSSKPLIVTEFGIDAWDNEKRVEDERTQTEWASSLLDELFEAGERVLGGCYFEWTDEWHKAGTPHVHDFGGYVMPSFPDGFANEEWFGVCRLVENAAGGPDVLQPRAVYQAIKSAYTRS
jgi:hypothetical protein